LGRELEEMVAQKDIPYSAAQSHHAPPPGSPVDFAFRNGASACSSGIPIEHRRAADAESRSEIKNKLRSRTNSNPELVKFVLVCGCFVYTLGPDFVSVQYFSHICSKLFDAEPVQGGTTQQ
jgi:hypothetical protein